MTVTETLITEVESRTKIFFDSIETPFNYREKHYSKFRALNFITALSLFLFILNIFPIIPYATGDFERITNLQITIFNFKIPLNQFYLRWILFASITGILYLILRPVNRSFDKKEDKHSINEKQLSFAYLYKAINELEIFLVNDRKEHTIISLKYLRQYLNKSFLNHFLTTKEGNERLYLPKILSELEKEYNWIKYSESTEKVIRSFNDFEPKIIDRIIQIKDIDLVIKILKYLLTYEYLLLDKVKVEHLSTTINDNSIASNLMIIEASEKIKALSIVDRTERFIKETTTIDRLNRIADVLTGIFTHQNLLINFFSWMTLLGLIFTSFIYLGETIYRIKIDSTIYIGAVSGVIIGAITISATIYSKRK